MEAKCADCNFRTITFGGENYCTMQKHHLGNIFKIRECKFFKQGSDGINPEK